MAGCVSHEVSQELSDFILLTSKGGMNPWVALFCNFLSGCTATIAAGIAFSVETNSGAKGVMLCFSAGTYIWIALTETLPGTCT